MSSIQCQCCVIGGGPAGVMTAFLLARRGVVVTLLEAHHDFDRDFRGDTLHPSILEIVDSLGLSEKLLALPHGKMRTVSVHIEGEQFQLVDMANLSTPFPYITMLPQSSFLQFMVDEAKAFPSFRVIMGARAQSLIRENGQVRGITYRNESGSHELRSNLTIATDGRFSKVRQLADMTLIENAPPMDILWFRLPRHDNEPAEMGAGVLSHGKMMVMLNRQHDWQIGYIFPKGGYKKMRAAGLESFRQSIAKLVPWLADRVARIDDWKKVALLSVASGRVKRWYRPGLLLIGDAAHVMSPVGGVGINYAVQDAVVAANVLADPLYDGRVTMDHLREVQKQRSLPTRFIQGFQRQIQQRVVASVLREDRKFRISRFFRWFIGLPLIRKIPARMIGIGLRRVNVEGSPRSPNPATMTASDTD